jgi:hypothetical protein
MRKRRQLASRPGERLMHGLFIPNQGVTDTNKSKALMFMSRLIHPIFSRFSREN